MSHDPRLTPANGQTGGTPAQIGVAVADLWRAPDRATRDRQLQWGEHVQVFETRDGMSYVQAARDGYVGYVEADLLTAPNDTTHRVAVPATHLYPRPDIKVPGAIWLGFGARLRVVSASGNFFETDQGHFVPKPHLRPLNAPFADPVTVAQMHFGVPYLWGGNSTLGIDCSGLVQAALLASRIECPGDSDLQEAALGSALPQGSAPCRGDLLFWKGHVAMAVDDQTLIHANAHHMAVAYEPIETAIARIADQGGGPVTAHKRL
ncbi:C40 family peptidase [Actibacterium sp. XHP0104]|uniref:C40 family peptidase n=1 Tax=Actibacterium sp. XHP0104 TaxID=2984335 RepID=UPI0021E82B7C|nr:C40 family peptidase [Actibacterium sp. XHP0104]MCV2881683.1 C40 family peptidase [Actibacterium sp. XHP0104]